MADFNSNELYQDIVKHADIVKIISSFIPLTKKGKDYVGVCPFHDDTDPSLRVSPTLNMFNCFVCHTGGTCITFVEKYLHISTFEAMKKVAEMSGFDDPRLRKETVIKNVDEKKNTLLKCLSDLTNLYQYALNTAEGQDGLAYFEKRNLNEYLRDKFKLGYAFKDGKTTCDFLIQKGHSIKTIEDIGIAILKSGQYVDKNEGRVIFPLCDEDGNVIGYSARRLDDSSNEAKYINSPETYVFHKSNILYNFHNAKDKAKIAGHIYICEGFMDVFALAKIGIENAVAIMGTALTTEHIRLLRMLNVEVRLCLDGDLPGQSAMMKAAKLLNDEKITVMIVDNQGSTKDPDEILNQDGENALRNYLNKLLNRVDFSLNYYKNSNPLKTSEQKRKYVAEFIPILNSLTNQLDFESYLRKLSEVTGYDVESLRSVTSKAKNTNIKETEKIVFDYRPEKKLLRRLELAERELLYQMINNPNAIKFYEEKVVGFYDELYRTIATYLIDYASNREEFAPDEIISFIQNSDLNNEDKKTYTDEIVRLCMEKNHPRLCNNDLLENLLTSINEEKDKIFQKDSLEQRLKDKTPFEKARIYAEINREKSKK